jgi:hypothetical protein
MGFVGGRVRRDVDDDELDVVDEVVDGIAGVDDDVVGEGV